MRIGILAGVTAFALAGCLGPSKVGVTPTEIRDARVLTVDRPAFGSGILHVYAVLKMATPYHGDLDVHVTYFGPEQDLPETGMTCTVIVQAGPVDGTPARPATSPTAVASSLSCGGKNYRTG